jgi:hypothetical protein
MVFLWCSQLGCSLSLQSFSNSPCSVRRKMKVGRKYSWGWGWGWSEMAPTDPEGTSSSDSAMTGSTPRHQRCVCRLTLQGWAENRAAGAAVGAGNSLKLPVDICSWPHSTLSKLLFVGFLIALGLFLESITVNFEAGGYCIRKRGLYL